MPRSTMVTDIAPFVLASTSPRRKQLLEEAGLSFEIVRPEVDETPLPGETPVDYVLRNGALKAQAACARAPAQTAGRLVLASDTIVVSPGGDRILEKPLDASHAKNMLEQLSGRTHEVISSLVLWFGTADRSSGGAGVPISSQVARTKVEFAEIPKGWIDTYVTTKEPCDKAGAYAIQGLAGAWVKRIEGSYTNVVGLPLCETLQELSHLSGVMTFYRQKLPVLDSSEAALDHLVAVSKNQSGSRVRLAYAMGQRHFGESYVQELTAKRAELADLRGVTWHFIGRIQSNKIEALATCADVIHSLEDAAKAKALAAACSRVGRATPMQVFIKPELSNLTPAASGCSWETARELGTFLRDSAKHNGPLLWKGFMGIAPLGASETETERLFEEFMLRGKELWSSLCPDATQPNFSLGMSQDAPLARRVAAKLGLPPTVLRLGTSIFGERG